MKSISWKKTILSSFQSAFVGGGVKLKTKENVKKGEQKSFHLIKYHDVENKNNQGIKGCKERKSLIAHKSVLGGWIINKRK